MLLLVNFPNEAEGIDHLHLRLDSLGDVRDWLEWARLHYGEHITATLMGDTKQNCPRCKDPFWDMRWERDF